MTHSKPKGYVYYPYPKAVTLQDGRVVTVTDCVQHSNVTGKPYGEDGQPIVEEPAVEETRPPTMEEILQAGYHQEVADKIFEEENRAHAAGEKPYGDKERPVPQPQTSDGEPIPTPSAEPEKSNLDFSEPKPKGKKSKELNMNW